MGNQNKGIKQKQEEQDFEIIDSNVILQSESESRFSSVKINEAMKKQKVLKPMNMLTNLPECQICFTTITRDMMRYKCLICPNFDVCGICYEKRKRNNVMQHHEPFHPQVLLNQVGTQRLQISILDHIEKMGLEQANKMAIKSGKIDYKVNCVSCDHRVKGILYQCDECINFYLCHDCYANGYQNEIHNPLHPVLVNVVPVKYIYQPSDIVYQEQDIIGQGMFAKVYRTKVSGINSNNLVVKVIQTDFNKDDEQMMDIFLNSFESEIMAIQNIYGQSLIKTIGYATEQCDSYMTLYLIQEYMNNGTLQNLLNEPQKYVQLSCMDKFKMIVDLIRGIARLHHKKLIHRDIKPDNIFFSNYQTKLGDFGISMINKKQTGSNNIGNMEYLPKEYWEDDYDEKIDIYSFGLVFNLVFTGDQHQLDGSTMEIKFTKKSHYFFDIISNAVDQKVERKSAVEIEEKLDKFKDLMESHLRDSYQKGINGLTKEQQDEVFRDIYQTYYQLL